MGSRCAVCSKLRDCFTICEVCEAAEICNGCSNGIECPLCETEKIACKACRNKTPCCNKNCCRSCVNDEEKIKAREGACGHYYCILCEDKKCKTCPPPLPSEGVRKNADLEIVKVMIANPKTSDSLKAVLIPWYNATTQEKTVRLKRTMSMHADKTHEQN